MNYKNEVERALPAQYPIRWLIFSLGVILSITFFPYLFEGRTFLPTDLFDTMTAPYNAEFGPPQAQNHYIFDGLAQALPYKIETKEAFEKGRLSYWNPHILGGYPQYAECLGSNFDIFNVLLLWFEPIDVIHWETFLELLVAGIGMLFLLRFLGIQPLINVLFASAYMLNSMFISSAQYRCPIASFCWIPFVVLMLLRFFHTHRKENLVYASIFLALVFLGGNFQTAVFAVFIVSIIILLYPSSGTKYKFIKRFGTLSFIGLCSFALSSIMWLPSLQLLYNTIFEGGSLNSTNIYDTYSITQRLLSLPLLIMFFFPELLGNAQSFNLRKIAGVDIINFNGAIAFLPALFALWGCFVFWKRKQLRPFIIISVLGVSLPIATPLFSALYHRFFIVTSFSLCIIGAVALQSFIESKGLQISFARFLKFTKILLGAIIISLIGIGVYLSFNYQSIFSTFTQKVAGMIPGSAFGTGNESWMFGRVAKTLDYYSFSSVSLWLPILGAVLTIIAFSYYIKERLSGKNLLLIIFFVTTMQLFLIVRTWLPSIDTHQFPIYPKNPITTYLQKDSLGGRFAVWRDGTKDPYILPANGSNVYKTNDIHGYEVCTNRTMSIFHRRHNLSDSLNMRLLGLANVKYIIAGKRIVTTPNLRRLYIADSLTIYENLLGKPRAYFSYSSKVVGTESEAANELLREDFDGSTALFTKEDAPHEDITLSEGANTIHFARSDNNEVAINAQSSSKGILILTDTYYPGWKCYVNGIQKPIYRVNHCMRAVIVDAGNSTIIFRFEPDIFSAGMSISALAALLSISAIVFLKQKKKNVS